MITKTRRVVLYENQFQEIVDGEPYPVAPEELVGYTLKDLGESKEGTVYIFEYEEND